MAGREGIFEVGDRTWRVLNQVFASNSYICATGEGDEGFLVDPGLDPDGIQSALNYLGLSPVMIFCTHGHFDHAGSSAIFQDRYAVPCYLHGNDLKTLRGSNFLMMIFRIPYNMQVPQTKEAAGLTLSIGGRDLSYHGAPGHTPGSCIIQWGDALFTGDTLYSHGVGLSKLPGEDPGRLKATLLEYWDRLPLGSTVFPGHGESAMFAQVRRENLPLLKFLGLEPSSDREQNL